MADLSVKDLVITGLATDSCVLAAAHDAHMRGYRIRVPKDRVAAQTGARSARALALMSDAMMIDTRTGATVLRSLFAQ